MFRMEGQCSRPRDALGRFAGVDTPEAMRDAMAGYVRGLHQAYLDAADLLSPGDRAQLPLLSADEITVAAVGTRVLHVIATTQALPAPRGQEVGIRDSLGDLHWTLRFYDPVIIPALGLIDESDGPAFDAVRRQLGVSTVVYHLAVPPGSSLTPHHAQHAGTGLAHGHASAVRDFERLRAKVPQREPLIDEIQGAWVAGLPRAQVLLARALAPGLDDLPLDPPADPAEVRKRLLAAVGGGERP